MTMPGFQLQCWHFAHFDKIPARSMLLTLKTAKKSIFNVVLDHLATLMLGKVCDFYCRISLER
jgi:hypothetical protein